MPWFMVAKVKIKVKQLLQSQRFSSPQKKWSLVISKGFFPGYSLTLRRSLSTKFENMIESEQQEDGNTKIPYYFCVYFGDASEGKSGGGGRKNGREKCNDDWRTSC